MENSCAAHVKLIAVTLEIVLKEEGNLSLKLKM